MQKKRSCIGRNVPQREPLDFDPQISPNPPAVSAVREVTHQPAENKDMITIRYNISSRYNIQLQMLTVAHTRYIKFMRTIFNKKLVRTAKLQIITRNAFNVLPPVLVSLLY